MPGQEWAQTAPVWPQSSEKKNPDSSLAHSLWMCSYRQPIPDPAMTRPLSLQAHSFRKRNSIICCLIQQSFHYLHISFDQCYKSTVMFNTRLICTCQTLMMTILLINFALDLNEIRCTLWSFNKGIEDASYFFLKYVRGCQMHIV